MTSPILSANLPLTLHPAYWSYWLLLLAWVGHAYIAIGLLNNLYSRPISKAFLKIVRLLIGLLVLAFPLILFVPGSLLFLNWYFATAAIVGGVWFPIVTVYRATRKAPAAVISEATETIDLGAELGAEAIGNGLHSGLVKWLPLNDIFRVDFTRLELAVANLPDQLIGLKILMLTDLHFHGTPSRAWFDRLFAKLEAEPVPDLVVLGGDYLDSDEHHEWISEFLGRLHWRYHGLAVLGNHDFKYQPDKVRLRLSRLGYCVLGNRWQELEVRGEPIVVIGHEGPWFQPVPDIRDLPQGRFQLCLSHSPDNFPWASRHQIPLTVCGHVHGGQIRLPIIGSIFVPSYYGRRFDMGVFQKANSVLVASRGISGKEPFRWRCNPQVLWLTLCQADQPDEKSTGKEHS